MIDILLPFKSWTDETRICDLFFVNYSLLLPTRKIYFIHLKGVMICLELLHQQSDLKL